MKYPNWNEYDSAKKWQAVADEVTLETNNATTKADLTNMVKFLAPEAVHLQVEVYKAVEVYKENIRLKSENKCLKRALSDIEDWCVEFHATGPHDPNKALKIVMTIYDIANEQLGDRTEECRVSEEGER